MTLNVQNNILKVKSKYLNQVSQGPKNSILLPLKEKIANMLFFAHH